MLGRITHLITFSLSVLIIRGYPSLLIYRKVNNGLESLTVTSQMEIEQGTNLSLICKVFDGDKYQDGELVWNKLKSRLRSSILENAQENGELYFMNVASQHQGTYYCLGKFLYKKINLKVRKRNDKRIKRDDPYNLPDFQELLDKMRDLNENYNSYGHSNDGPYDSYDDNKRNDDADDKFKQHDILPKFLYMMFGGLAIFVLIYILTKCCHENGEQERSTRRSNQSPRRARSPCSHSVCLHFREQDPNLGCILGITPSSAAVRNHSTASIDEIITTVTRTWTRQDESDIPLTHITDDEDIPVELLDLPPTYEHSAANSRTNSTLNLNDTTDEGSARNANSNVVCDLPPTYEEATLNIQTCSSNSENNFDTSSAPDNATCDTGDGGGVGGNDD